MKLAIKGKWLLGLVAGIVLAAAVAVQFRSGPAEAPAALVDLHAALAAEPEGWTVRDLPIGETEMLQEAAAKTLRYDSYFYRSYRKGGVEFTVYVAYWSPGKHPPQMITQHVPDRCWTLNGMTCEEMRFDVPVTIGGAALWPAQWRKFKTPGGQITYTMFWHLVGGRPYDFGHRFYDMPDPVTFWQEAARFYFGGKTDQYFLRITSNVPPEQVWSSPALQQALAGVARLGFAQPAGKQGR